MSDAAPSCSQPQSESAAEDDGFRAVGDEHIIFEEQLEPRSTPSNEGLDYML